MRITAFLRTALAIVAFVVAQETWALADTTGSITGKVTDQNGSAIAGAKVTAADASQTSGATTGTNGFYAIVNLNPDTYAVTASKDGYDTTTVYGVTVTQNQTTAADIKMRPAVKTIGHITTTATSSVVSKTVTGDLYAVNAAAINRAQGSSGGAETLYSQNSIVGSLPGVVRYQVGSGPGYTGQGQLSLRGGQPDQVGFELDGVPLNRGFDFYNGTTFNTNGLASLQVYTGGAPADAGRAMSGYVNEVISRGKYPGGADFTLISGTPLYNHSAQADVYGGTPDNRFTYYVSTLGVNNYVNFGDRSNLANTSISVPAGDAGCAAFNASPSVVSSHQPLNCSQSYILNSPVSQGAYTSNPFAALRDTAANLNWQFQHNGLNDNLQMLYVVGTGLEAPYGLYGTYQADPAQASTNYSGDGICATGNCPPGSPPNALTWPTGTFYKGATGHPYSPALLTSLTWPTSNGSVSGPIPSTFQDSQSQQYSIEKVGYTRALTQGSFLRLFGYVMYSGWTLDQPINGFVGSSFYQLHDNATGMTLDYENQINQQNLVKLIGDWSRDLTLRYNYFNYASSGGVVDCAVGGAPVPCTPGAPVVRVGAPLSNWSTVTPLDWDGVISDTFKPNDKVQLDLGLRWDEFAFQLMPMQITGPQGLAYLGEEANGMCLNGYAYSPSDPRIIGPNGNQNCHDIITAAQLNPGNAADQAAFTGVTGNAFSGKDAVGAAGWQNVSNALAYFYLSPRFGMTFNLDPRDVLRASVGRYVQPANSAFVQYADNPIFGPGRTVRRLNQFYTGLNFLAVHNVLPEDSTNYDLSLEHEFSGGYSLKLTPFYRNTRNQVLQIPFNPQSPSFTTGDNFGVARISGFEFLGVRSVTGQEGLGGTLAVTFTNSLIRFDDSPQGGGSFIDLMNGTLPNGQCATVVGTVAGICGYNAVHGTHYALLDPKGYYHPSYVMSPNATTPSYSVPWVINLGLDWRTHGFDVLPTFNYQSGNPYGEPLNFPDPSGLAPNGPDPYTRTFDSIGAFKGPSWWTLNMALSHDIAHNLKASILGTNLISGIHNQGYPWELPANLQNISYQDNTFYNTSPLGALAAVPANPATAYYGSNYYPYSSAGILPMRTYVFAISGKI